MHYGNSSNFIYGDFGGIDCRNRTRGDIPRLGLVGRVRNTCRTFFRAYAALQAKRSAKRGKQATV